MIQRRTCLISSGGKYGGEEEVKRMDHEYPTKDYSILMLYANKLS